MPQISSTAVVEAGAELADDVRVGAFAYIGPAVKIGPGCIIENNATIVGRTTLGARNRVFPMAVIGQSPDTSGRDGLCVLGDANAIREHVTIYAGLGEPTIIGDDNLLMIGCQVGPSARVGDHGIFANCTHIEAQARVQDYVRSSAFTIVYPQSTVGAYTFLAGYTGIDHDAPPFAMVQGFPYRVRGINAENLKRCGFGEDDIRSLKQAFRELWDGVATRPDATVLQQMLADAPSLNPHVRTLLEALQRSGGNGQVRSGQHA